MSCLDCVVHPHGDLPSGYHLASQDQVNNHKEWILGTLEKWAVAKFETGYVSLTYHFLLNFSRSMDLVMEDRSFQKGQKKSTFNTWLFAKRR